MLVCRRNSSLVFGNVPQKVRPSWKCKCLAQRSASPISTKMYWVSPIKNVQNCEFFQQLNLCYYRHMSSGQAQRCIFCCINFCPNLTLFNGPVSVIDTTWYILSKDEYDWVRGVRKYLERDVHERPTKTVRTIILKVYKWWCTVFIVMFCMGIIHCLY
jgi:hypothetical protein